MNSPTPRVTVVVPNYNHARYIGLRIDSILAQTYQDFELLYLDDASTDDSAAVVEKYRSHPKVRMIHNERNSGSPFKQWNLGVREARGELVWIAEADDHAKPDLLATLVETLDAHRHVGVAYCQSIVIDAEGSPIKTYREYTNDLDVNRWGEDFVNDGRDECSRFLARKCTIPNASAVVFRRQAYLDVGAADESFRMCGDWMLWSKLVAKANVAFVATPHNFFRSHTGSVTHHATKNGLEVLEGYRVLASLLAMDLVRAEDRENAREWRIRRWMEAHFALGRISWRRHLEIYREASRVDPSLRRRLFTHIRRRIAKRFVQNSRMAKATVP